MTDLVITHAQLITPHQTHPDAAVLIANGRIQAIENSASLTIPAGASVIDAGGMILSPGFIELQINGAFGEDFTQTPPSIWSVARELPRFGVTSFLPTVITSPLETAEQAMQVLQTGRPADFSGAEPLGLHLEGPFLNPARKGAHNPAYLRLPDPAAVSTWTLANGVRLATLAPELPGALETIRALRAQGVVVSAGHTLATYEQAQAAFEAGVSYGTHLFNANPPLEHRAPNLSGALLTTSGPVVGLIVDGIHVHPAMVKLAWLAKGSREITLVTDAMAALGMAPGVYQLGDYAVTVDESSARLPNGTLAGSVLRHDKALRNLAAITGCTLAEALPTFTSTPARVLGLTDRGLIQPGYLADLVLLTPDGHVRQTLVQGKTVFKSL